MKSIAITVTRVKTMKSMETCQSYSTCTAPKNMKELGPRTAKLALFHVKIVKREIV